MFSESLNSIFQSKVQPTEVIIVDDAMDAKALEIVERFAQKYPIRIVSNKGQGVSSARNAGAGQAVSEILMFMDTDVVLLPQTLQIVDEAFIDPQIDGIVGVQSERFRFTDFFSRWKNHWMRFTYQRLSGDVHLFYTSCAAIRRKVFMESSGFDEEYRLPSIEDTAFGADIGRQGVIIRQEARFEIEHVKSYNLWGVLKTDRERSAALAKYTLRNLSAGQGSGTGKTSVPFSFIMGSLAMFLAWVFALGFLAGFNVIGGLAISLVSLWILNTSWLAYLFHEEGSSYLVRAFLFLPIDVTWVNIGIIQGIFEYLTGKKY
ncbi:glycosyltransferase [bacterium]|nr:glycosyltransferase [bacterium]